MQRPSPFNQPHLSPVRRCNRSDRGFLLFMKLNREKEISIEELRRLFDYNTETGVLTRKISRGRGGVGKEAGCVKVTGRRIVGINGRDIFGHRVCYAHYHGYWPQTEIDHRNEDASDNRIANLRAASRSQNESNKKMSRSNTSGMKGVCFHKPAGKWVARIEHNQKVFYLGVFHDKSEAEVAVRAKREELHGAFANHG